MIEYDYRITNEYGHCAVYINGEFYCTADNFGEALAEVESAYREEVGADSETEH